MLKNKNISEILNVIDCIPMQLTVITTNVIEHIVVVVSSGPLGSLYSGCGIAGTCSAFGAICTGGICLCPPSFYNSGNGCGMYEMYQY